MSQEQTEKAWVRPVRLACGFILIAYLLTHFANHSLGLVSLAAMGAGRQWFLALWRNPVGEGALLTALLVHWLLGLWLIYRRRTLRMPAWEAVQILFGLAVPPLLVYHVVGTRGANALYGTDDPYLRVLFNYGVQDHEAALRQAFLFTLAWAHGCIGLHFWLRFRPWYPRIFPYALTFFVLMPVLAALGATVAAREVAVLAREPGFGKRLAAQVRAPTPAQRASLVELREGITLAIWSLLALTLLARFARESVSRMGVRVRIRYPDGRVVAAPRGWTVLEASRANGIPHASVCGGRSRCSTCRIRVAGDPGAQPPSAPLERRVLERIGASPNIRLACQLRPARDIAVAPLLQATFRVPAAHASRGARGGEEREIAVLFADLRGFTRLAEGKLPYDVVFILNRYFESVGGAVAAEGGIANQFTGDGVMALFGVEASAQAACRQALRAAGEMVERVGELSRSLAGELPAPLRIGIGIHSGPVVVGEMGYGDTHYLTAVGDTVNAASRLEELTKSYHCELVVSERVLELAGLSGAQYPRHEIALRNREAPLTIAVVADARAIASAGGNGNP